MPAPVRKCSSKYVLCTVCAGPVYRRTVGGQCSQSCYERSLRQSGMTSFDAQKALRHTKLQEPRVAIGRSIAELGKGDRAKLIAYLLKRDGNRCQIPRCQYKNRQMGVGPRKPSLDHIIPLSKGGENALTNIQLAHFRCNLVKNAHATGDQLALIG